MHITLLTIGKYPWGIVHEDTLKKVAKLACDQPEIVGELLNEGDIFLGRINEKRISHRLTNIRYNHITKSLMATAEMLPTPCGKQLKLFLKKQKNRIHFKPVFSYDDSQSVITTISFITANAVLKDIK